MDISFHYNADIECFTQTLRWIGSRWFSWYLPKKNTFYEISIFSAFDSLCVLRAYTYRYNFFPDEEFFRRCEKYISSPIQKHDIRSVYRKSWSDSKFVLKAVENIIFHQHEKNNQQTNVHLKYFNGFAMSFEKQFFIIFVLTWLHAEHVVVIVCMEHFAK